MARLQYLKANAKPEYNEEYCDEQVPISGNRFYAHIVLLKILI